MRRSTNKSFIWPRAPRGQNAEATESRLAAVYLLHRRDRNHFKVGWSHEPAIRVRQLPEFKQMALDLAASRVRWFANRRRAEQIERSLHKVLAPFHHRVAHRGDGHEEWFEGCVAPQAMRMLAEMPQDRRIQGGTGLQPFLGAWSLEEVALPVRLPQEVWSGIEDLLARLARHRPIQVEAEPIWQVVIQDLRAVSADMDQELQWLRQRALDGDSYQCWQDGEPRNFVRTLAFREQDLVLTLMPPAIVEAWPGGQDLGWQIRGFLVNLKRRGSHPSPGFGGH